MQITTNLSARNGPYMPHPRDFVLIVEGTPYTVPVDKIFVLTGLGSAALPDGEVVPATLTADAATVARGGNYGPPQATVLAQPYLYAPVCTMARVPHQAFAAGVVLAVTSPATGSDGRACGYTAPA